MKRFLAALAVACLCTPALAQQSQPVCFPAEDALKAALTKYHEQPMALGLAGNGKIIVLTLSPEGSWTIWIQPQPGILCQLLGGDSWDMKPALMQKPRQDT